VVIRRTLLALLLGLLTTLLIACTCALLAPRPSTPTVLTVGLMPNPSGTDFTRYEGLGFASIEVRARAPGQLPNLDDVRKLLRADPSSSAADDFTPPWLRPPAHPDPSTWFFGASIAGWPKPCLRAEHLSTTAPLHTSLRGGLRLFTPTNPSGAHRGIVPLLPIWPGLLTDTALFSSPWLLLLLAIPAARHLRRRFRGLCKSCGYDLSATPPRTPCPECGAVCS
jgi:hypothetical protein